MKSLKPEQGETNLSCDLDVKSNILKMGGLILMLQFKDDPPIITLETDFLGDMPFILSEKYA